MTVVEFRFSAAPENLPFAAFTANLVDVEALICHDERLTKPAGRAVEGRTE